jgi:hypothetical protein
MSPLALSPLLSVVVGHLLPSVCIHTASVYLGACFLFCVPSPVALLPVPPVVVGDLPPLVCRSPVAVAVFFLVAQQRPGPAPPSPDLPPKGHLPPPPPGG